MLFFWSLVVRFCFFFFNDTATTEIYTLSLHDALPIFPGSATEGQMPGWHLLARAREDRKSTRLKSSHTVNSYAVFCLKKKKTKMIHRQHKTQQWKSTTNTTNSLPH